MVHNITLTDQQYQLLKQVLDASGGTSTDERDRKEAVVGESEGGGAAAAESASGTGEVEAGKEEKKDVDVDSGGERSASESMSWADEVEAAEEKEKAFALQMPKGPKSAPSSSASSVNFTCDDESVGSGVVVVGREWARVVSATTSKSQGSLGRVEVGGNVGRSITSKEQGPGFFRTYVHIPRVHGAAKFIGSRTGVEIPRTAMEDLSLALYVRAAIPDDFQRGSERQRMLEHVGDAALRMCMGIRGCHVGMTVKALDAIISSLHSNNVMATSVVGSGLSRYVVTVSGVSLKSSKASANVGESVAGVLMKHVGVKAVAAYMRWMQLME